MGAKSWGGLIDYNGLGWTFIQKKKLRTTRRRTIYKG